MIQWFPGHMKKTGDRIREDLRRVDVVYELRDARIPDSSSNPDLETWLKDKPRIVLLMKADLADPAAMQDWIRFYGKKGVPCVAISLPTGEGLAALSKETSKLAEPILEKQRAKGMRPSPIRIMVVGIPNVGKSSLINRLAKRKSAKTGDTPGVTRTTQWIKTKDDRELLDTPGVLWPKLDDQGTGQNLAFTGAITDRILDSETLGYELLEKGMQSGWPTLLERYDLNPEAPVAEEMERIGRARGYLVRGGEIDWEKTGSLLLDEFRSGRWGRISLEWPR